MKVTRVLALICVCVTITLASSFMCHHHCRTATAIAFRSCSKRRAILQSWNHYHERLWTTSASSSRSTILPSACSASGICGDDKRRDGRSVRNGVSAHSSLDADSLLDYNVPLQQQQQQDDRFLRQVETTVDRVLLKYYGDGVDLLASDEDDGILLSLPREERAAAGVARHLHERLRAVRTNRDCRRCWLQQAHCICREIQPLPLPAAVHRIFLLTHHKEICMAVDTAKLILAAFPDASRLVVGGVPGQFQESMNEMMEAVSKETTLVLFPSEEAKTFADLLPELNRAGKRMNSNNSTTMKESLSFDLIVLDGTWEQARRMYKRYISAEPAKRVQLSLESLRTFGPQSEYDDSSSSSVAVVMGGRQLRRHPVPVREIATAHALQLLLQDIVVSTISNSSSDARCDYSHFSRYQEIASAAAVAQLGPPRLKRKP